MYKYFICLILGILAFVYKCPPALDLWRYYYDAEMLNVNTSIFDFAIDKFQMNFDFIYFTIFLIVKKIGLPKEIVNFLFVSLYYLMNIKILELFTADIKKEKIIYIRYLVFFMLTSVGLYIIFSISRNLAAISIFLLGLYFLLKGKKYFLIFWVLSVFTHTGMILYISLFSLFYFIVPYPQIKSKKSLILLLSISAVLLGRYSSNFIGLVSNLSFFDTYSRYSSYTEIDDKAKLFSSLGLVETIGYFYFCFTLFFGYYFLKNYSKLIWASFGVFLFLLFSFGFSIMFVQRSLMFMLPFQGVIAVSLYKENFNNRFFIIVYSVISTISIILFFGYLYSYRGNEMF